MRDKLRYYFDSITANIDHWQPFLKMSRDASRYATDMIFCHIFSFGVVSAPMSYSLSLFPFP